MSWKNLEPPLLTNTSTKRNNLSKMINYESSVLMIYFLICSLLFWIFQNWLSNQFDVFSNVTTLVIVVLFWCLVRKVEKFYSYIEDNDLWRKSLPYAHEFASGIRKRGINFDWTKNSQLFEQLQYFGKRFRLAFIIPRPWCEFSSHECIWWFINEKISYWFLFWKDVDAIIAQGREALQEEEKIINNELQTAFKVRNCIWLFVARFTFWFEYKFLWQSKKITFFIKFYCRFNYGVHKTYHKVTVLLL